jgi:hypothetical protein
MTEYSIITTSMDGNELKRQGPYEQVCDREQLMWTPTANGKSILIFMPPYSRYIEITL